MTRGAALTALTFILAPTQALAHISAPGAGQFYDGFYHAVTLPPSVLALLALGLLLGQNGKQAVSWGWPVFATAVLAGLGITMATGVLFDPELPLVCAALAAAVYVAGGLPLPVPLAAATAAVTGLVLGITIKPYPASWTTMLTIASGAFVALNFVLLFIVSGIDLIRQAANRPWVEIALRAAASWIAAICILLIALAPSR